MYENVNANSFIIFIVHIQVEYCVENMKLCTNFFSCLHEQEEVLWPLINSQWNK